MSSDEQMIDDGAIAGPSNRSSETNTAVGAGIGGGDSQTTIARKTWELQNSIENVGSVDEIYRYDEKQQKDILTTKPWERELENFH